MEQDTELLTSQEIAKILRYSYDRFRRVIQHQPDFPAPFKATEKSHPKWFKSDIENYIKSKTLKEAA